MHCCAVRLRQAIRPTLGYAELNAVSERSKVSIAGLAQDQVPFALPLTVGANCKLLRVFYCYRKEIPHFDHYFKQIPGTKSPHMGSRREKWQNNPVMQMQPGCQPPGSISPSRRSSPHKHAIWISTATAASWGPLGVLIYIGGTDRLEACPAFNMACVLVSSAAISLFLAHILLLQLRIPGEDGFVASRRATACTRVLWAFAVVLFSVTAWLIVVVFKGDYGDEFSASVSGRQASDLVDDTMYCGISGWLGHTAHSSRADRLSTQGVRWRFDSHPACWVEQLVPGCPFPQPSSRYWPRLSQAARHHGCSPRAERQRLVPTWPLQGLSYQSFLPLCSLVRSRSQHVCTAYCSG